jgi:hypothetical protein
MRTLAPGAPEGPNLSRGPEDGGQQVGRRHPRQGGRRQRQRGQVPAQAGTASEARG